ncbi:P-II family nitrogen regulator [Moritella sp. Urea-trap-13]|uniref:P-II family nitrogen regulator n=1 Tax=Moritella sp. Urea-trap-13 TaxID=2058327 RepID=UPI000C3217D5|nr:P-II family nitrogen regulator [Moritella sp. Urea-trap-13]PKH06164.1 P-II family nitrogen regulator [Moritella sp. Urea-trap-13]
MSIKKVTAIFDELRLQEVENALQQHGITGFTIHKAQGRGAYVDNYNRNQLSSHIQMDIYTNQKLAKFIAKLIIRVAHVNAEGEGLVSITPIEALYWIHTKHAVDEAEFTLRGSDDE